MGFYLNSYVLLNFTAQYGYKLGNFTFLHAFIFTPQHAGKPPNLNFTNKYIPVLNLCMFKTLGFKIFLSKGNTITSFRIMLL